MVGAGGFGREALDVVEAMAGAGAPVQVLGVLDDAPSPGNLSQLRARGLAHLGGVAEWAERCSDDVGVVVGIASPAIRRRIARLFAAHGRPAFTAVHPSAVLGTQVVIESGAVVCAGVTLSTNVRLGHHVLVNPHATIGHDTHLGNFTTVYPAACVSGSVSVGESAMIGASSTILQGLSIGAGAVVGAAALVTKDVPADVVVTGVPGRWREP